jgi:hypothetical protein
MIWPVKHPLKTATSILTLTSLAALAFGELFVEAAAAPVFNVVEYGAQRDGSLRPRRRLSARRSRQRTPLAEAQSTVPAGKYVSGPIEMFSNITLDIAEAAMIEFPITPLPLVPGR